MNNVIEEKSLVRQAVGAVIRYKDKYILVYKVKIMEITQSPKDIKGEWDFVKGGIKSHEKSKEKALFRELKEEAGSTHYRIIKEYSKKLRFEFPSDIPESGTIICRNSILIVLIRCIYIKEFE